MNKDLTFIFSLALILSLIYIVFVNNFYLYNSIDNFSNTINQDNNYNSLSLAVNSFISKYPGTRVYYVKDSSSYLLPKGIYVFAFDPYEPNNKFGNYVAKINGEQIFRNDLTFRLSNIKNEQGLNLKYLYNLHAFDIDGQDMLINFDVQLIQIPKELFQNKNTNPNSSDNLVENFISNTTGIDINRINSAGSNSPGVNLVDNFLKMYPGAQAYYVTKSLNESLLPSNSIVYSYNPINPSSPNGNRLASSTGIPTFIGEYGLEFTPDTSNGIYGVDSLDVDPNVIVKDGYTKYLIKPLYNNSNVYIYNFTAFMHPVPNDTFIN